MQERVVMLMDLDYFFAQCEEKRNPAIKDKPVVVCVYSGRSEDSGAVSTSNYIARKYGVKSGIPIALAKKKLRDVDAVFLPVDHAYYREISDTVMAIAREYADRFEQVSVDEAYLDVSQKVGGNFEEAGRLAQKIKDTIKARQELTCSIGVGPNKLVAKIASGIGKPDGLTVVKPEQVKDFLFPLPVGSLMGVGKKTEERMGTLGIKTVSDLAEYDSQRLTEIFGKNLGAYFHNAAQGIDDEPVQERGEAESISRIATLKENTRNLAMILDKANQLCIDVHTRLLQRGLSFKSVGVVAVMKDLSIHSRSKSFENPTDDIAILKRAAKELFERLLRETELEARRVGVKVSGFAEKNEEQKQLTRFF